MKAILLTDTGGPEVLQLGDIPIPEITQPDQVLVRLKAAAVNPLDIKMREGVYPLTNFPFVPGWDGAGIVEAIGADVTTVGKGDEVYLFYGSFGKANGNYAEYTLCRERNLAAKPKSLSFAEAAAAPLVTLTAWEALFDRASLQAGQSVLIHAGAGGIGHVAIQLAVNRGITVYTTVGNQQNAEFVSRLGASHVINYKTENFVGVVSELTKGEGVDAVLDTVGGETMHQSVQVTKFYGNLVTLIKPGDDLDLAAARMRNLRIGFETVLVPVLFDLIDHQLRQQQILTEIAALFDSGQLHIKISEEMPLEDAAQAHIKIDQGGAQGKIVLLC